ncbi:MAG TPA: sulfatase-like hydrolase/transferase [Polyangiaceae bacterium]|jgi:hypothetical protein|nr:sulfatase-like hydrolase/transferase [Polyangiaceae bacterium]
MAPRARAVSPWLGRALRLFFVAQFPLLALATRGASSWSAARVVELVAFTALGFLGVSLDRRRDARAGVALSAAAYLVLAVRFYRFYHTTIDAKVVESLLYSWRDVWPVVAPALPAVLATVAVVALFEYALLATSAGAFAPPRRLAVGGAVAVVTLCAAAPALGVGQRYFARSASEERRVELPELPSTRARLPNVLVLLTESVRASDYCAGHGADCATSPELDRLLPDRIALTGMRAVASYTAVSVAALFTGKPPLGSLGDVAATPGYFDYLKAVRAGGHAPAVAYWSAQLDSVFWRRDVRHAVDSFVAVDDLVGHGVGDEDEVIADGVDRMLTTYTEQHLRTLPTPFSLVLHFQGTHAPYFVDEAHAPFQPMSHTVSWSGLTELHAAYRDAIFEQDRSIARCVRAFLDRVRAEPWVIVFTSDHGEAFGEHGAIHHGQNLYDEQIHVPAWIAASNGGLDDAELEHLRSYRDSVVTHFDVLPTLLDVAGVLDGYALAGRRRSLIGRSLVAAHRELERPVPMTNCTALFPCPLDTWGMLDGEHALVAQPWDADFRCVALRTATTGASDDCASLRTASSEWFALKPNGRKNR